MWTTRWVARSPELVLDEIESYMQTYGAANFDFYDLTAIVKRDWIIEFANMILARGLKFTWQLPSGTRTEAIDSHVARLLYRSGCRNVSFAPESGSTAVLERTNKKIALPQMEASIRISVRSGLNVKLNIIMGFPDERRWELFQTIRFMGKMAAVGAHDASVSQFAPYPGSALFDELRAAGTIAELTDDYMMRLGTYKDFSQRCSFAESIGPRELNAYRMLGMLAFYGTQYALRPWRLARTIHNLLCNRQESRLDRVLRDFAHRRNRRHESERKRGVAEPVVGAPGSVR
jgi:radical SAM superfamily enzyme YgiQ (UPF0313 family)